MSATQLEQQAHEARALLHDLAEMGTVIDDEAVELVVASETDLASAVAAALVEAAGAEAAAEATAALIAKLALRRERQLARAERTRARIAHALSTLGLRSLPTPAGHVSLVAAPPKVLITEPSALASEWWKRKTELVLDRSAIRKALLEGIDVPGATLSNRPPTIRVRT